MTTIDNGWKTRFVGAGGLLNNLHFGADGTMFARADTYGVYKWSGTIDDLTNPNDRWIPLYHLDSMYDAIGEDPPWYAVTPPGGAPAGYELVSAPSNSARLLLMTMDLTDYVLATVKGGVYIAHNADDPENITWRMVHDPVNFPNYWGGYPNDTFNKRNDCKMAFDPANDDVMYAGVPINHAAVTAWVDPQSQAAREINPLGNNNSVAFTAVAFGTSGNSITVRYVNPGTPSASLSVDVTGNAIVVNLATNGSSVITTTAADIITAIEADAEADALVSVVLGPSDTGNTGAGVVTAMDNGAGGGLALAGGSATPTLTITATTHGHMLSGQTLYEAGIAVAVLTSTPAALAGATSTTYPKRCTLDTSLTIASSSLFLGYPQFNGADPWILFRSLDGGDTWDGTFGEGQFAPSFGITTETSGVAGIIFDPSMGEVVVEGQTRTARMLVGVSGRGVYESWDGGVTFTLTTGGPTINFYMAKMNAAGTYFVTDWNNITSTGLWRYTIGASQGNGTWHNLVTAAGWPNVANKPGNVAVDPRVGHEGKVWAAQDVYRGYYSANADAADPDDVTWQGGWSNSTPGGVNNAASYDIPWMARMRTTFAGIGSLGCDPNGRLWATGAQNIWYFDPNPTYLVDSQAHSCGRGVEGTVTGGVCRPPGSPAVLLGMQDIGFVYSKNRAQYPLVDERYPDTTDAPSFTWGRASCQDVQFATGDPAFVVVRCSRDSRPGNEAGSHWNGYSEDYGKTITPYATQPDAQYGASGTTGGQLMAFDRDNHFFIPSGINLVSRPCRTTQARHLTDTAWALMTDLPSIDWFAGSAAGFQASVKMCAVDGVTVGTGYIYQHTNGDIWRTTDFGATWAVVGNRTVDPVAGQTIFYSVPGYAGHLWLTVSAASGTAKLWRSTDGGATWFSTGATGSAITLPASQFVHKFALGAPRVAGQYPTLILCTRGPDASRLTDHKFYRSEDQGETWTLFGTMPDNIPRTHQLDGIKIMDADWRIFGKCYVGLYGSGWFQYEFGHRRKPVAVSFAA